MTFDPSKSTTTNTLQKVFTCPACNTIVLGTIVLHFVLGEIHDGEASANVKVGGLRVQHDCTPKTTRGSEHLH